MPHSYHRVITRAPVSSLTGAELAQLRDYQRWLRVAREWWLSPCIHLRVSLQERSPGGMTAFAFLRYLSPQVPWSAINRDQRRRLIGRAIGVGCIRSGAPHLGGSVSYGVSRLLYRTCDYLLHSNRSDRTRSLHSRRLTRNPTQASEIMSGAANVFSLPPSPRALPGCEESA